MHNTMCPWDDYYTSNNRVTLWPLCPLHGHIQRRWLALMAQYYGFAEAGR